MLNEKQIIIGTGCSKDAAPNWIGPLNKELPKWGIESKRSVAAFLANVGVETGGLKSLVENLNYSAQGLANTWPGRYSATGRAGGAPNALANSIARKPELIANNTYANRYGNGSVASGDGWRYRGRGLIQTTFKDNYAALSRATGIDFVGHPEWLEQPGNAVISACYFFKSNGCVGYADAGNFNMVVKRINGAPPNGANHGELRRQRYEAVLKIL